VGRLVKKEKKARRLLLLRIKSQKSWQRRRKRNALKMAVWFGMFSWCHFWRLGVTLPEARWMSRRTISFTFGKGFPAIMKFLQGREDLPPQFKDSQWLSDLAVPSDLGREIKWVKYWAPRQK